MLRTTITLSGLLLASTALGQFNQTNSGGSASYGAFGNRTIGAGTSAGQSGFSSGQTSGTGSSNNSLGGMSGNSGMGGSSGMSGSGGMGSSAGGGGQVGGSPGQEFQLGSSLNSAQQRSQAGFIGADTSEAGNLRSMQGTQQGQANAFQNAFSQLARQNQQRNQNQNQQNKKQLRIAIKADIANTSAASTPSSLGRQFETRLTKLPGLDAKNVIHVQMEGRTAVLTGSVVSDRDRKLAEGLALLEPGISAVQNELAVVAAATRAEELPAPRRSLP